MAGVHKAELPAEGLYSVTLLYTKLYLPLRVRFGAVGQIQEPAELHTLARSIMSSPSLVHFLL
jgi:hypothetical protein